MSENSKNKNETAQEKLYRELEEDFSSYKTNAIDSINGWALFG